MGLLSTLKVKLTADISEYADRVREARQHATSLQTGLGGVGDGIERMGASLGRVATIAAGQLVATGITRLATAVARRVMPVATSCPAAMVATRPRDAPIRSMPSPTPPRPVCSEVACWRASRTRSAYSEMSAVSLTLRVDRRPIAIVGSVPPRRGTGHTAHVDPPALSRAR